MRPLTSKGRDCLASRIHQRARAAFRRAGGVIEGQNVGFYAMGTAEQAAWREIATWHHNELRAAKAQTQLEPRS